MATVQKIDKNLIESVMKDDIGWKRYLFDAEGDFVIDFAEEGSCPELRMYLTLSGSEKEIFGISIFGRGHKIPQDKWPKVLATCNEWNQSHRWPRICMNLKDGSDYAEIICDAYLDLEKGIHRELLTDFIQVTLGSASQFWEWAIENEKL